MLLFAKRAIDGNRKRDWVLAGMFMCVMLLANAFGLTGLLISLLILLVVNQWRRAGNVILTFAGAYLVCCPFLPPSLFSAISKNQQLHGQVAYGPGSLTAVGLVLIGCATIWWACNRLKADWWVRFVSLLAWITVAIPLISTHLGRTFLPQPGRYKIEAEFFLCLFAVFAIKPLLQRWPVAIRSAIAITALGLAAEQVVSHRRFAKDVLRSADPAASIEYRVAGWTAQNLPNARVWYPGSLGQWANTWTDVQQMTGGSWSTAYNQVHQRIVSQSIYGTQPTDAENALIWLRSYGVQAFVVPGKQSPEFWKPISRPELFDGCEVLWAEDDTRICRVPGTSPSFARIVSRDSVVRHEPRDWSDVGEALRFDTSVAAEWHWRGTDAATIRGNIPAGKAVAIQVTHHPGWRAVINGKEIPIHKDGLGLMWLDSPCSGPCEIQLNYSGGWELWLCRFASVLTLIAVGAWLYRTRRIVTTRLPQVS